MSTLITMDLHQGLGSRHPQSILYFWIQNWIIGLCLKIDFAISDEYFLEWGLSKFGENVMPHQCHFVFPYLDQNFSVKPLFSIKHSQPRGKLNVRVSLVVDPSVNMPQVLAIRVNFTTYEIQIDGCQRLTRES